MKSVYSALFLDDLELRKFQIGVRNEAAVDAYVDMYIPPIAGVGARVIGDCTHILREASTRCPSYSNGQCEGLKSWDGQQVLLSRFFYIFHGQRGEALACKNFNLNFMSAFLRSLLTTILSVMCFVLSYAETTATIGGIKYEYDFNKKYAIVSSSSSSCSGAVNIPNEVKFTDVPIGDQKKDIVAEVKEIASKAFLNCTKITSVTANKIEIIGSSAFQGCSLLETVALGNTLKTIDADAFNGCEALRYINLPEGLIRIRQRAFCGCISLFRGATLKIPASVISLGGIAPPNKGVFQGCGFQEVDYGTSIDIPLLIFADCKNLKSISFNANVQKIGDYAFSGCTALGSASNGAVELPNNCTEIGCEAFSECTGMKNVTFKNALKTIGSKAFYKCTSLTGLSFGEGYSDLTFGDEAFADCSGITSIVFLKNKNITFGNKTFSGLSNLERLELAEGIVSLGTGNFNDLTNFKRLELAEGIVSLGSNNFNNCSKLTDFVLSGADKGKKPNLPSTITGIDNCFNNCSSLTYVDLPAPGSKTFLVTNSFVNCDGIKFVTIDPENRDYQFDKYSFSNSEGVRDAVVPRPYNSNSSVSRSVSRSAGSVRITNGAFNDCQNLISFGSPFVIGAGGGLYNCKNLVFDEYLLPYDEEVPSYGVPGYVKKAILKETVRVLHEYAISNVDEINIPDSLRVMHKECLKLNVTELTLPSSVSDIYRDAIDCGSNLKKLTILNPVPPVYHPDRGSGYICNNQSLVTLYVPYGSGEAYRTADGWMKFKDIVELEQSDIKDIESDSDVTIEVIDGQLVVTGSNQVCVYNMLGRQIYTGHPDGLGCVSPGMYIVRVGKTTAKVVL